MARERGKAKRAAHAVQAGVLRVLLGLMRPLPMEGRRRLLGAVLGLAVALPPLRRRVTANLDHVGAALPRRPRPAAVGRAAGRALAGLWFNADFAHEAAGLAPEGPGWEALLAARAEGRGAIVVSGHFGQWEALRHVLKAHGMEAGAIYRVNNNPFYERLFRAGIDAGGQPIVPKGAGYRVMTRHLKAGGIMALLPDQHVGDGVALPFLGREARTSTAAAKLATRYGVPLVPAFAPEVAGRIRPLFEAPIPPGDPEAMMRAFHDHLGARVRAHPEQWYWLHRRWKGCGGP